MSTPPPDYTPSTLPKSAIPRQPPSHPLSHLRMTQIQDLHPTPPPPSARPDFVAAAMRTPRDYDLITRALRQHDTAAMFQSVTENLGPIRTGSLLGLSGHGLQGSSRREWKIRLNEEDKSQTTGESEKEKEVEEEMKAMVEDTEEDEEASAIKRKKKKKKAKKNTINNKEEVKVEVEDVVDAGEKKGKAARKKAKQSKPAPIASTRKEEDEVEKQLQDAEEGNFELLPSPSRTYDSEGSDATTIRAKSRRISPDLSAEASRTATPKPVEMSKDESITEEPIDTLEDDILHSIAMGETVTSTSVTVKLPPQPCYPYPPPIVSNLDTTEADAIHTSATMSSDPSLSPEIRTPAEHEERTILLPSFNVSSPEKLIIPGSPTPTETDEDLDSPRIIGLGGTGLLGTQGRGRSLSPTGSDDSISSATLAQLTSFAPRDTPSLDEEPSTPESSVSSLPMTPPSPPTPLPTTQLIAEYPSRYLSPSPSFGSPLRYEVLPFDTSSASGPPEHSTAQSWSLFYSDTDRTRAKKSSEASAAERYQDNLVPIFTADNLVDLFGRWKALRRQIATSTGRQIELPHSEITLGQMGLGLHCMSIDNNFHFFREGVKPMWEDKLCANGGKFMFAGDDAKMDNTFFDLVLLLVSNQLSLLCPAPPSSGSEVVGLSLARRPNMSRIEVWLGGPHAPDPIWIKKVQEVFTKETRGERVFEYKAFGTGSKSGGGPPVSRSGSGGLGGKGQNNPLMGRFGIQGGGNGLVPGPTAFRSTGMARSQSLGA